MQNFSNSRINIAASLPSFLIKLHLYSVSHLQIPAGLTHFQLVSWKHGKQPQFAFDIQRESESLNEQKCILFYCLLKWRERILVS